MTSTPLNAGRREPEGGRAAAGVAGAVEVTEAENGEAGGEDDGVPPLPDEWEELIDNETKHRFFANHKTRQTSWTDPRDKLVTVNLIKGGKGLGLGISGAKRTRDGRLVLGIFVSSLVPGSAADVDGTLREGVGEGRGEGMEGGGWWSLTVSVFPGDEVLEVNGHSLIGVSREG